MTRRQLSSDRAGVNVTRAKAPTLRDPGVNLQRYADPVRLRVTVIRRCVIVHGGYAMDGSQKLPQHMLDSVRWHLANHSDF